MSLTSRRVALGAAAGVVAALFLRPFSKASAAQQATLISKEVPQVSLDPGAALWQEAQALEVPLAPQAVVKPRIYEGGVKSLSVKSAFDDENIAFLLEWKDADRNVTLGGVDSFRDAVALLFPAQPSGTKPYFGMGEPNNPVVIYHWKGDWQFARDWDVDEEFPGMVADDYPMSGVDSGKIPEAADYAKPGADKAYVTSWSAGSHLADSDLQAKTSVEKLMASGFGTLESASAQDGRGNAQWQDGAWRAVISFPRKQEQFSFQTGPVIPVAFAAWDGARRERGGEKSISTWYFLSLEQPSGALTIISPVAIGVGLLVAQFLGLRLLRGKKPASSAGD